MKEEKNANLLKFTEYDHLQMVQKPNKLTEIGGFSILENISLKNLLEMASKNSGKCKIELENLSINQLIDIVYENEKIDEAALSKKMVQLSNAKQRFKKLTAKKSGNFLSRKTKKDIKDKDKKDTSKYKNKALKNFINMIKK